MMWDWDASIDHIPLIRNLDLRQKAPEPWQWTPDFPKLPARVAHFIATGKIVSYEQLAAGLVSRVTITMTADVSMMALACALASKDVEHFTCAISRLKKPWYKQPKMLAYIALWTFIGFGILSWAYFTLEAAGWL